MEFGLMNKEETIDKFVCFMKDELEKDGYKIGQAHFNFALSHTAKYVNNPDELISEGDDLTKFKSICKISDEEFKTVINACLTNDLVKEFGGNERNYSLIQLTEKGLARANCVEKGKDFKPMANYVINGNINASNLQIGNNNNQNIENAISQILNEIDKMNVSEEQKKEAKGLLQKFTEHPVISGILSGVALKALGF